MKKALYGTTRLLCLLTAVGGIPVAHAATTIFSSLGPGDTHGIGGYGLSASQFEAFEFSAVASAALDSIDTSFFWDEAGVNSFVLQLRSDAAGVPGAILESWNIPGLPFPNGGITPTNPPLLSVSSAVHPGLTGGTSYWLALGMSDPNSFGHWVVVPAGAPQQQRSQSTDGGLTFGPGFPQPDPAVFRLVGTAAAVPEPTNALLIATGLVSLIALGWRRKERPA